MEWDSGKKKGSERRKRGHEHEKEKESRLYRQADSYDGHDEQGVVTENVVEKKKREKKHRDGGKRRYSEVTGHDADGISVDLDVAKAKYYDLAGKLQEKHKLAMARFRDPSVKTPAEENKRKRKSNKSNPQEYVGAQLFEPEQDIAAETNNRDEDEARRKHEKRRRKEERRAARKLLAELETRGREAGDHQVGHEEDTAVEAPKKKRKLDEGASEGNFQRSRLAEEPSIMDVNGKENPKLTPKKKKRKHDQSFHMSALQLKSRPASEANWYPTSITKASPKVTADLIEENGAEISTPKNNNKWKRSKLSQDSPLHLLSVPSHQPPWTPKHTHFDEDDYSTIETGEEKTKKKRQKNAEKSFLVPSSLLPPTAKVNGSLLQTVIKGFGSHVSSSNLASEVASKVSTTSGNSTPLADSSEDEGREETHVETPIRPPKSRISVLTSPTPIRPKKAVAKEIKKETPIPPPKKLTQTAIRSPLIVTKPTQPKEVRRKPMKNYHNVEVSTKPKSKGSVSKDSKTAKPLPNEDESLSQTIASIKTITTSKIHGLFSADASEEEEGSLSQVVDSIKKSSSKLQSLFSPKQDTVTTACSSIVDKEQQKSSSVVKVARPRSVSASLEKQVLSNEDESNTVRDDWETTIGKVRSTVLGGDDTEAQENIAFSSTYITSRTTGIKISNTTFQMHTLRHNDGWIVSSSSTDRESESDRKDFKLKICTVISGRAQVRLSNDRFWIGKGCVFRVRSGEECVVRNWEKKGAVVWVVCVE